MSEKYKELLEQYDVKVLSTFRSRGTFQCETEQGLALLKEYHGSLQKLALEYEWKKQKPQVIFLSEKTVNSVLSENLSGKFAGKMTSNFFTWIVLIHFIRKLPMPLHTFLKQKLISLIRTVACATAHIITITY